MKRTTRAYQAASTVKPIQESQNEEESDCDNGSDEENDPNKDLTSENDTDQEFTDSSNENKENVDENEQENMVNFKVKKVYFYLEIAIFVLFQ